MVVPHGEDAYYQLRPSLGIARPDDSKTKKEERAVDLDGFFGFHPNHAVPCSKHGKVNNLPSSMPVARPTNRAVTSKPWNSWSAAWTMNAVPPQAGSDVTLPR